MQRSHEHQVLDITLQEEEDCYRCKKSEFNRIVVFIQFLIHHNVGHLKYLTWTVQHFSGALPTRC